MARRPLKSLQPSSTAVRTHAWELAAGALAAAHVRVSGVVVRGVIRHARHLKAFELATRDTRLRRLRVAGEMAVHRALPHGFLNFAAVAAAAGIESVRACVLRL